MSGNKHIVIVTSEFPPLPGGIGNHAYHLALYLSKKHFDVTVIADQRSEEIINEIDFDKNLPFLVKRIKLKKLRFQMYLARINTTYQAIKRANLVIATGKFSLWSVAYCTFFINRPTLAIIHGSEVNFQSFGLRMAVNLALKKFAEIVAVSNYTRSLVSNLEKEIKVIPNGIKSNLWEPVKNEELKKIEGYPVLTTVGRVSVRKGQLEVIKLLPDLKSKYPEIHYHCIGIPSEADNFMAIAKTLGVDSNITFHGMVSHEYLKAVLQATDVFVMLSTESKKGDVEGFGIAILEANAMGVPAIGSKGCGIEDAIDDGITGFLIEQSDSMAFSNAINQIIDNRKLMSEQAIKWAYNHSWESIINDYIKLIVPLI